MKETRFIEQNKKKWARFEELSNKSNYDAEELSKLYIEITDDLSYAQTKYPRRAVRVYLNSISQKIFNSVYVKKKKKINFFSFWVKKLPLELYASRKNLLMSFIIFGVAMLIGIFSQEYDHDFARIILSDYYVEMTEANIAKDDPLAVYNSSSELTSFLGITQNNIRVALITFVLGALFSIGTFYILLSNGIMVGAFQWFFKTKGLLLTSFLGIWIHGAFEISSIVIAGAAGITMGNGLLFPGTLTRTQSLIRSAKRGLRIMLGLIPFIIIAGFLESYVTRHYASISDGVKWSIIIGSFAVMSGYFVIYPFIAFKKWGKDEVREEAPNQDLEKEVSFSSLKSIPEMIADSFYYYRTVLLALIRPGIFYGALLFFGTAAYAIYTNWIFLNYDLYWYEIFGVVFGTGSYFNPITFLLYGLAISLIAHNLFLRFKSPENLSQWSYFSSLPKKIVTLFVTVILTMSIIWFLPYWSFIFIILLLPFIMFAIPLIYYGNDASYVNVWSCFSFGATKWGSNLGLISLMVVIVFVFFQILAGIEIGGEFPDFLDQLITPLVGMHISSLHPYYWSIICTVKTFFFISFILLMLPMLLINLGMGYFSVLEYRESEGLKEEFNYFGNRSKTREAFNVK